MTIKEIKALSKEEFMKQPRATEELYNNLQKSKQGWIKISRKGDGAGDWGMTEAFGEGLSCRLSNPSRWYVTSVIQSIDWKNHTFETMNSTYDFEFKTKEELEKERKSEIDHIEKVLENYGRNQSNQ